MKNLKRHPALLFFGAIFFFIISFFILKFFITPFNYIFYLYWATFAAALMIIFSPLGNKKLDSTEKTLSFARWLTTVITLELSLFMIFLGTCHLIGLALPIFAPTENLLANALQHNLWQFGLFPWPEIAILASVMGYVGHHQKDSYLSTIFYPLFRTTADNSLGITFNTAARATTMIGISLGISLSALFIIRLFFMPLTGFSVSSLIIFSLLIIIVSLRWIQKPIYFLAVEKRLHPFVILLASFLLLIFLVPLLSSFFNVPANQSLPIPFIVKTLLETDWLSNWQLFSTLWWVLWIPVSAIFIAHLSKGLTWRKIILGVLALPVVLALLLLWPAFFHGLNAISKTSAAMMTLIGIVVLTALLGRKSFFTALMQAYLPHASTEKNRPADRFLHNILKFSTILLCLYLTTGIFFLNFFLLTFSLILIVLLLLIPLVIFQK